MPQDTGPDPDRIGPPNRRDVFHGLKWLKDNAGDRDLSIVFLGGHGWRSGPNEKFWFLTQEADLDDLVGTAVSGRDLLEGIHGIRGKKILFLDACHSGAAIGVGAMEVKDENRPNMDEVVGDFTEKGSGIVAYAAARAQEPAWEFPEFDRHSAFAKALIEAFGEGKGAVDGVLKTDDLYEYLKMRVGQLAALKGKVQEPVENKPDPIDDFAVAVAARP